LKIPLILIIFLSPALFSFIVSYNRCKGEYHTQRLYFFQHTENWKPMQLEAKAAINAYYTIDPTSAPIEWYNGVALFSSGDIHGAKTCFEKAFALAPYNMHVINNLASCYESLGDHRKAEQFYLKALSISSGFEEARLNLSAVYYNTNQFIKAYETIEKCDIHTSNPKYATFLAAILDSWTADLSQKEEDAFIKQKLLRLRNNKEDLFLYYMESKKKGTRFKDYLLQQPL
jgi:tetratricopeptide (TPR) repeat protein